MVPLDHQLDRVEPAALHLGMNEPRPDLLDPPHAPFRVVGVPARQRARSDKPAKRFFSEHGGPNECGEAAIP